MGLQNASRSPRKLNDCQPQQAAIAKFKMPMCAYKRLSLSLEHKQVVLAWCSDALPKNSTVRERENPSLDGLV